MDTTDLKFLYDKSYEGDFVLNDGDCSHIENPSSMVVDTKMCCGQIDLHSQTTRQN
jgi:hypothetical protein